MAQLEPKTETTRKPSLSLPPIPQEKFTLCHSGITHDVYIQGFGPAVVLMHELPGMTPNCLRVAQRFVDNGYRVHLPLFFGSPNQYSIPDGIRSTVLCIRHEFNVFNSHGSSTITPWLRELCRRADAECGHRGVGLIGMCLTGNVVLSVVIEPSVRVRELIGRTLPAPFLGALNFVCFGIPTEALL